MQDYRPIENVGTARRTILNREIYNYRGVQWSIWCMRRAAAASIVIRAV